MPKPLLRLKTIQRRKRWPKPQTIGESTRTAYTWVHRDTHLLNNKAGLDVLLVRRHYRMLLAQMRSCRQQTGLLGEAPQQFWKVTRSYWRGLFACYTQAALPHTNNALEQQFGSYRHHERRCTGRKVSSAMTVVRGSIPPGGGFVHSVTGTGQSAFASTLPGGMACTTRTTSGRHRSAF